MNVGSALWLFHNPLTKNKSLWVQGISHHSWRACQQFHVDPSHSKINCIVFTSGSLSNPYSSANQDEHQCLEFLKAVLQRLSKGFNIRVVLNDMMIVPDIINYIAIEFRDKLKKLFLTGASINKIMSYVNSYPEFLTFNLQKRI